MTLIGTIGTDLQKQTTTTGKEYLKYAIAVNSRTKAGDSVSWFNIACFSPNQIDFMERNLAKGSKIYLEAEAKNTSYEKEDGTKSFSLMLFQSNFEVLLAIVVIAVAGFPEPKHELVLVRDDFSAEYALETTSDSAELLQQPIAVWELRDDRAVHLGSILPDSEEEEAHKRDSDEHPRVNI
ncbi:hypothetical protein PMKS-003586 [Pichia membranifaciens]|uniref:Single-stranded DNA-binding protein n=1 Tax=Pichia membranifaciens TaxID=4926 RepID=A0A1Q2YKL9_9ASCO|nr:hypothetical protein PMKS-003586 [Pichia membranifaciens]